MGWELWEAAYRIIPFQSLMEPRKEEESVPI